MPQDSGFDMKALEGDFTIKLGKKKIKINKKVAIVAVVAILGLIVYFFLPKPGEAKESKQSEETQTEDTGSVGTVPNLPTTPITDVPETVEQNMDQPQNLPPLGQMSFPENMGSFGEVGRLGGEGVSGISGISGFSTPTTSYPSFQEKSPSPNQVSQVLPQMAKYSKNEGVQFVSPGTLRQMALSGQKPRPEDVKIVGGGSKEARSRASEYFNERARREARQARQKQIVSRGTLFRNLREGRKPEVLRVSGGGSSNSRVLANRYQSERDRQEALRQRTFSPGSIKREKPDISKVPIRVTGGGSGASRSRANEYFNSLARQKAKPKPSGRRGYRGRVS